MNFTNLCTQAINNPEMTKRKQSISSKTGAIKEVAVLGVALPQVQGDFYTESFFKKYWKAALIIIGVSYGLYYTCLPFNYVLDDQMVITGNSFTKKGFSGIWDILTTESFEGYFGEKKELVQGNRYRPLSIVTFAIEYGMLGDMNPWLGHFINILLYAITGILLMMVLVLLFRNFKTNSWWMSVPFLATLLFIVHPIHTEAVANIKGRDEIMSMLFSLLALYSSLRFMDAGNKKWLIISFAGYFLGLLSKENAITFLAVIPLTIYFFSDTDWRKLKTLLFWLLVATIAYLILRFNTAGIPKFGQEAKDLMNNPFLDMKSGEKFGSIMYSLGKYIQLMFWPHPLSHDYYPYAIPKASIFTLLPFLSLVLYGVLVYFGFKGLTKKSVYSYSILYYLITLTIVSNIVINLGTFMNERFIFMASAGFCIAVAYFISEHLPKLTKNGRLVGMALAMVAVLGYGAKTYVRVPVWKDALSLNEAAVAVSSNSARANSFMSTALFEKFKVTKDRTEKLRLLDQAEYYGLRSVGIVPDYQNPNLMLIGVASERYKLDDDINNYIRQVKPIILRRPDISFIKEFGEYLKARGHDAELFPFYLESGKGLMQMRDKRRDWALQYLTYAYELQPNNRQVNEALAQVYEMAGNANQAARFKSAAQLLQ
jgi:protein O-mannosyl-transferase